MTDDRIEGNGVMARLREETMDLHRETEHGDFQRDLLSGRLSTGAYADLLEQLLVVHRSLESVLRERMTTDPALAGVVREEQFVESQILDDLAHYGRRVSDRSGAGLDSSGPEVPNRGGAARVAAGPDASDPADAGRGTTSPPASDTTVLPATIALTETFARLAEERPASLLGAHYVFEGSKNGGRFIARAMRGAYGLAGPDGFRYLEPYGEEQPHRWKAFKAAMETLPLSSTDQDAIVDAAKETFRGIMGLHRELYARLPVDAGHHPAAGPGRNAAAEAGHDTGAGTGRDANGRDATAAYPTA